MHLMPRAKTLLIKHVTVPKRLSCLLAYHLMYYLLVCRDLPPSWPSTIHGHAALRVDLTLKV